MTEIDYKEILSYIMEKLNEIGATEAINYVKEMEKISITEVKTDKPQKSYKTDSSQFMIDKEKFLSKDKNYKKEKNNADLSTGVSRQMTYREIVLGLISMMKKSVTSVPDLVDATKKLLGETAIVWVEERGINEDRDGTEISLEEINLHTYEEREKLKQALCALETELMGEEPES